MSLEELLKDTDGSSNWKVQRKRLLRIAMGVLVLGISLAVIIALLFSPRKRADERAVTASQEVDSEHDARALAELIRLQRETAELRDELQRSREPAQERSTPTARPAAEPRSSRGGSRPQPRIVSVDPGEGFRVIQASQQDFYIPTGSVFKARLITPIKTSIERTFVMAETTAEFRMDANRRIPSGSRLIGRSRLNPILRGVIVEFDTLVLPSGIETSLSSLALSRNALPEIEGLFFSDRLQTYGTALSFGFLGGFSDAVRRRDRTILGALPEDSVTNHVLAGVSSASFQVAEEMLRDIRTRAVEYVVVPAGERVFVALTRRYEMNQGESR